MRPFRVHVGEVLVDSDAEAFRTEAVEAVLRAAFLQLGHLIQKTPFARWVDVEQIVLDRLELQPVALDELLGPFGAARLAEELYAGLERGWS